MKPARNKCLHRARKVKNDEFYTLREDIDAELQHYEDYFEGKSVYCNCDDYRKSNFAKYFTDNFDRLGLKRLEITGYGGDYMPLFEPKPPAWHCIVEGGGRRAIRELRGDGDFRSRECEEILHRSDIICTNPPFSMFEEYVKQLMKFEKKFLIIGNANALAYKGIFERIKNDEMRSGTRWGMSFDTPHRKEQRSFLGFAGWLTNMHHGIEPELMKLNCKYEHEKYPRYDNYDAIEVPRLADIPIDYRGMMGVPSTYLMRCKSFNAEILKPIHAVLNGKRKFSRILIKAL